MKSKKLFTGGLTLALILSGAIYAYAQDNSSGTSPSLDQQQSTPAVKDHKHDQGKPSKDMESRSSDMQDRLGESYKQLSTVLGMPTDEIKAQLKAGKSIAELAQSKGIAQQDLINKLVASASQKVDDAVKAGKLQQEKADQIKSNLPDRIKKLVEHKGLPDKEGRFGHERRGIGMMPKLDVMAGWFNMSKDDLASDLKAGKTLSDIASQHGLTKDQLISKIQAEMKPRIDKFVSSPLQQHGPKDDKQDHTKNPKKAPAAQN